MRQLSGLQLNDTPLLSCFRPHHSSGLLSFGPGSRTPQTVHSLSPGLPPALGCVRQPGNFPLNQSECLCGRLLTCPRQYLSCCHVCCYMCRFFYNQAFVLHTHANMLQTKLPVMRKIGTSKGDVKLAAAIGSPVVNKCFGVTV